MKTGQDKISSLDIGSTKICCLVASKGIDDKIVINGYGHYSASGVRQGSIVDMKKAAHTIGTSAHTAEKMADTTLDKIVVNVSGGSPESKTVYSKVSISGQQVDDHDIRRVLKQAYQYHEADRQIIHTIPINFMVDEDQAISDPHGMFGKKLGLQSHVVTSNETAYRNLMRTVESCHLDPVDQALSSYAAGLACLVDDEKDLGVTLIDMGGGSTSIAIFVQGNLRYADSMPIGGNHVTKDIAHGLSTPIIHAERLKTLYGSAIATPQDDQDVIEIPQIGDENSHKLHQIPKSILVGIIQPRLEETFEMVRDMIDKSGLAKMVGRRVVLTGGAAQLPGVQELAGLILNKQVRIGYPQTQNIVIPREILNPAFSTAIGLLQYYFSPHKFMSFDLDEMKKEPQTFFERVGLWLKENF